MKAILLTIIRGNKKELIEFVIKNQGTIEILSFNDKGVVFYKQDNFLQHLTLGYPSEVIILSEAFALDENKFWDDVYSILAKKYTTSYASVNWAESFSELFEAHKRAYQNELLEAMTGESC